MLKAVDPDVVVKADRAWVLLIFQGWGLKPCKACAGLYQGFLGTGLKV